MNLPTLRKSAGTDETAPDPAQHDFKRAIKPTPNLAPLQVREDRGFAATVRACVVGVVALAGVVAIGFFAVGGVALVAESNEANATQQAAVTQAKIATLSPVQDYYSGIESRKGEISTTFDSSIQYSTIYGDLFGSLPPGVQIESFSTAIGETCPGGDPFNPSPAIGCATVTATAPDSATISAFTTSLAQASDGVLVDPYASDITTSGDALSFQLTANFNADAYSDKFADLGGAASPSTTAPATGAQPSATNSDAAAAGK